MRELVLISAAYLVGAIPCSYLLVKWLQARDVREVGSGNAGATNVLRAAGPWPAAAVLTFDVSKGVVPVLAASLLDLEAWAVGAAGFAAVLGHIFPIYLGFRGGKGVATGAGAFYAFSIPAAAAATLVFVLLAVWKRYVSLASIGAAISFPIFMSLLPTSGLEGGWTLVPWSVAISILVVLRHRTNIRRLFQGSEARLGSNAEATR